jgi:Cupin domain
MTPAEFEARLRAEGFAEVLTAVLQPGEKRPAHAHGYEVKALLVLEGDITLTSEGVARIYGAGDTFRMAAGPYGSRATACRTDRRAWRPLHRRAQITRTVLTAGDAARSARWKLRPVFAKR